MAALEIHCLGGLSFEQDGLRLADLKIRKGQALLCYLAVNGKSYTRSALAGLLWADIPETDALMNLRKVLNRLKPFAQHLKITRETLAFNLDLPYWLDVQEFTKSADYGDDPQRLQQAVALYKGDFLESFDSEDIPLFNEWVLSQRAHLREAALDMLQNLIRHFAQKADYSAAIAYARQLLTLEPWHEETHRELMRLMALSGQRSAALKQYEICRRILNDELGVEPAPATSQLNDQIISGNLDEERASPLHSPEPLYSLPPPATPLIGRLSERGELITYLAEPFIRLVSIVGAGGVGKTHLALSIAHELAAELHLFRGAAFVSLGQITTRQHLIMAIADQLNLALAGTRDPEKILLDHLAGSQILIVLDNFEQLLAEVDFLERILAASAGIKLLITTRERLKIRPEWVLDLRGLPYPESADAADAITSEAVILFTQRARQLVSEFSIVENLKPVARICALVQGMPLALEIAASWIRTLTAREIADQIAQNLGALSTNLQSTPERHRTMQAVFDSSWRWLRNEEQSVMAHLSVFYGGFTVQAARQVAGASVFVLSALVDKSFLSRDPRSPEVTRYEIHELVRQYAYTQLQSLEQVDTARARHLAYFGALAEQSEQFWDTSEENEWLARLETERSNLYAALRYAFEERKVEVLLRLNAALFTFWIYNSSIPEITGWLDAALALDFDENNRSMLQSRAKVVNVAGYAAMMSENSEQAQACFEEGLALYSRLEDGRGIAWSLRGSGYLAMYRGDYALASSFVERSLKICQESQEDWGLDWSMFDLGYLALARGELEESWKTLEEVLDRFRLHGNLFGDYRTQVALGYLSYRQEHWAQAVVYYQRALTYQRQNPFLSQILPDALEGMAYISAANGKDRLAVQLLGTAQNRRYTTGFPRFLHYNKEHQRNLNLLRSRLGSNDFTLFWEEGYTMNLHKAVANALEVKFDL